MKAVVLVGGEGTRLRPITFAIPKQMLPVAGTTMLERVLGHLAGHGVDEAVLSLGYRPDAFLEAFPGGRAAGVKLTYAVEPEPLDTAGAIRFAARHADVRDTFIVVNGDVLTDLDITALVHRHRVVGAQGTIALAPVEDPSLFGVVPTDGDGRVTAFIEKPPAGEAPTNLINAGTYVLEPDVLDAIPADRRVSVEREIFPAMVAGGSLYAMASDGYWIDAGTPTQFLRANADLVARGTCPVPGAVERYPGVWTVGDTTVDGAVRAPVLVQAETRVCAGASVSASVLGEDVTVEPGASVDNSVLLAGARVAAGATVSGSIVGRGARIGAGAVVGPTSVIGCDAVVDPGARLTDARFPSWD
ncbi:MAG TPA: NDP-sugar synthase [Acidimicrobiales bacterium]|nr:NDP-sugar synthase [Acidimicrobiales bacterium]